MGTVNSYKFSNDAIAEAQKLIDAGIFNDFTKVVNFSMVFYLNWIEKYDIQKIDHILRENVTAKSVRLNDNVLRMLIDKKLVNRMEIPDYALNFYLNWLNSADRDSVL